MLSVMTLTFLILALLILPRRAVAMRLDAVPITVELEERGRQR